MESVRHDAHFSSAAPVNVGLICRMIVGTTPARGFRPPRICLDKPPQSGVPKLWRATPQADIGMRPADPAGKISLLVRDRVIRHIWSRLLSSKMTATHARS